MTSISGADSSGTDGDGGLLSLTRRALAAVSDGEPIQFITTESEGGLLDLPEPFIHVEGIDEVRKRAAGAPTAFLPEWAKNRSRTDWRKEFLSIASECAKLPIAFVLPASVLARIPRTEQIHFDALRGRTAYIIERDAFGSNVHRSFGVASWVIAPAPTGQARMFSCVGPTSVLSSEIEGDFSRLIAMPGGASEYGYVLRQGIPEDAHSLSVFSLDPKRAARRKDLESFGQVTPLQTWYELASTRSDLVTDPSRVHSKARIRKHRRTIRASGIRPNGALEPSVQDAPERPGLPVVPLQANDLLVSRAVGQRGRLRVGIVKDGDLPAVSDSTVIVLRPRGEVDASLERFIRAYLVSDAAGELLRANDGSGTTGIMMVTPRTLMDLEVPSPDSGLLAAIREVDRASARLALWQSNAEQLLARVFDEDSLLGARRVLLSASLELKDRVQLAEALDDPDLWLLRTAPLPTAFRWRTVVAMAQSDQADELAQVALGSFESSLSYYAQIAIAMARANGLEIGACKKIRQKLLSQREGTAIGDWFAVLSEVSEARSFQKLPEFAPLGEIREVLSPGSAPRAAVERLKRIRNDRAHDRNSASYAERLSIAREAVELQREFLLHSSRVTGDLTLSYVRRANWDSLLNAAEAEVSILKGDHWVVAPQVIQYDEPVEVGSLYIRDSSDRLHLMRPLLSGFECPECHTFSTFYIDANFDGRPSLKSIEHGHSALAPPGVANAMTGVGML